MKKLLVLQYQKLEPLLFDDFSYGLNNFRSHLLYLKTEGYRTTTCKNLDDHYKFGAPLPDKPVLITFDAGYAANFQYARPILKDFGYTATFFIVGEWILKSTCNEPEFSNEYIHMDQLRQLHEEGFELAMQGYYNRDFKEMAISELQMEIEKAIAFFKKFELPFTRAFAFPGDFRLSKHYRRKEINSVLGKLKIDLALQTGNKIKKINSLNYFEINRILVQESDSRLEFTRKIKKGDSWWI